MKLRDEAAISSRQSNDRLLDSAHLYVKEGCSYMQRAVLTHSPRSAGKIHQFETWPNCQMRVFALKVGLWFRLVSLAIFTPSFRHATGQSERGWLQRAHVIREERVPS